MTPLPRSPAGTQPGRADRAIVVVEEARLWS